MYRIHFTAAGALRTERAVLEFGPEGVRWRFTSHPAPMARESRRGGLKPGPAMLDFSNRWPAFERRRHRRAQLAVLELPTRWLMSRWTAFLGSRSISKVGASNQPSDAFTLPRDIPMARQENP
ncbi:MAG: hypothetical protein EPN60_17205 [Nevskiaceae bacterium]|nr:MAG: hypothetical protein EPO48_11040 [Nevskiaceae bacterium]TAM22250.1 MAG: hypothetical protein EPN60_17205 [Nevskiaceae bacterium]